MTAQATLPVMGVHSPPPGDHQDIAGLLWFWLRKNAPRRFRASLATGVRVDLTTTFEPDLLVVAAEVYGPGRSAAPEQVALAVEVGSRADRSSGRELSAAAGIAHYWWVERSPVRVFAHALVDGKYELVADSAERLVLTTPFEIDLAIRDITP